MTTCPKSTRIFRSCSSWRLRLMRAALTAATSRYTIGGNRRELRPITLAGDRRTLEGSKP